MSRFRVMQVLLLLVLVAAVGVAAGCGGDDDEESDEAAATGSGQETTGGAASGDPYVFGVSADITGPAGSNYAPLAEGIRIYFDALNDDGGIDGHPVEVRIRDNKSDPAVVASDMKFFKDLEGTSGIYFSSVSASIAAALQAVDESTPIIYGNACYPPAAPPDPAPNFFCVGVSPVAEARAMVDLLLLKRDASELKLGLLPSDLPGTRFAHLEVIKPYAEEKGIEVTDIQIIPLTVTDLTSAARRFEQKGVNAVISYTVPAHVIGLAESLQRIGWKGHMVAASYSPGNTEAMERVKSPTWYGLDKYALATDDVSAIQKMNEAAESYDANFPPPSLRWGWNDAMVIHRALEDCGFPCDQPKFLETISDFTVDDQEFVDLFGSPLKWSAENHSSPEKAFRLYVYDEAQGGLVVDQDWKVITEPGVETE